MKESLALKLGLTERQVTFWFSYRRYREKKLRLAKEMRLNIAGVSSEAGPTPNMAIMAEASRDISQRPLLPLPRPRPLLPQTNRVLTNHGRNQPLGGPIYGTNFDPLPPGAFSAPIGKFVNSVSDILVLVFQLAG
ncbi:hypothetical protein J5N97_024816 [Dioscorea zingiberensis]|uniref:Homeobox domain-containing protein n=1 Tax=Dioscorea zingiberensis TaxID=325984 RepID=A0A9D5C7L7_9LILI|nr:hypothetical protein J5N97_024816 [Dioscorea zingiberensis]